LKKFLGIILIMVFLHGCNNTEIPYTLTSTVQAFSVARTAELDAIATVNKSVAQTAELLPTKTTIPTKLLPSKTPRPQNTPVPKSNPTSIPNPTSEPNISGCPNGCTYHPEGCDIKGNISYNSKEKIYHLPGMTFYSETTINTEYGERWFCTEVEAKANGWRKALN
jgi:hypothetical protein